MVSGRMAILPTKHPGSIILLGGASPFLVIIHRQPDLME
jgi:hypothetical protein